MSRAGQTADSREQATPPAVPKAKQPRSKRFAKLWLHLANMYRLTIKEMRSIRADASCAPPRHS
jgi:ABC-2 type transport system permease protein